MPLALMGFQPFRVFPSCQAAVGSSPIASPLGVLPAHCPKIGVQVAPSGACARPESVPAGQHVAAGPGSIPSWAFPWPVAASPMSPWFQRRVGLGLRSCSSTEVLDQPRLSQQPCCHRSERGPLRSIARPRRSTSRAASRPPCGSPASHGVSVARGARSRVRPPSEARRGADPGRRCRPPPCGWSSSPGVCAPAASATRSPRKGGRTVARKLPPCMRRSTCRWAVTSAV